jgi:hypothetical protein
MAQGFLAYESSGESLSTLAIGIMDLGTADVAFTAVVNGRTNPCWTFAIATRGRGGREPQCYLAAGDRGR